jgi:hypothetical protein
MRENDERDSVRDEWERRFFKEIREEQKIYHELVTFEQVKADHLNRTEAEKHFKLTTNN